MSESLPQGVQVTATVPPDHEHILGRDALTFVVALQREFGGRRKEVLDSRRRRRSGLASGGSLDFLPETAAIRNGSWSVAEAPLGPGRPARRDRRARPSGRCSSTR